MSPAYTALVQSLTEQGLMPPDDIYKTDSVPRLLEVYEMFYDFANTHLQARRLALGFPTSYFFFRNDFSVNAFARTRTTYKMIGVNYGCIQQILELFEANQAKFAGNEFQSLHHVSARIGNPLDVCFFQFFSLFVYYHEYAHLVQRSPQSTFEINESLAANVSSADVIRSHAYELDADWYAASNLAQHMTQFFEDADKNFNGTPEELVDMTAIGLAAILCYFIKSAGIFPQLYLSEKSHPHAYIRLSYCSVFLLNTISPNLPPDLPVNQTAILNKAASIARIMLADEDQDPVADFGGIFMQNHDAIDNLINVIIDYAVGDPFLCRNRPMDQI